MCSTSCISLPILICLAIGLTECLADQKSHQTQSPTLESLFRARRTYIDENENCGPRDMEMVHTIMERICMLCHELRSHVEPNTRVECRQDCFKNPVFRKCMRMFSAKPPQPTEHHPIEPTAPVPLYTEETQTLDDLKLRCQRID